MLKLKTAKRNKTAVKTYFKLYAVFFLKNWNTNNAFAIRVMKKKKYHPCQCKNLKNKNIEEKSIPILAKSDTDFSPSSLIKHRITSMNKNIGDNKNKMFAPYQCNNLNVNAKTKKTK